MNDQTPRRYKGTLVERAAAMFDYGELPPLPAEKTQPAAPVPPVQQAPVAPPPAAPVAPPPLPPVVEQLAEIVAPTVELRPTPVQRAAPAAPPPAPEPVVTVHTRRHAAIDRKRLADLGMLVPGAPIGVLAEEFRLVKRQLLITSAAVAQGELERARMILVCSAQPDEGKTFCAINLALSMAAEQDVEILLVDADFAKPDVLDRLGIPEGPGLLDVLAGTVADVEDCIVETDVPRLSVLPAGGKSTHDTELLASARARTVLEQLAHADARRIVIFDSPPVLAASPASVLALHVGQVMLVVRADRTSESELREAVGLLEACEHIQLLLNSVSLQPGGRRFGSYYGESK